MHEPLGLILAGGQGTRTGGVLQAELVLGRATLLSRVQARLDPQVAGIALNANTAIATKLPVVSDTLTGHPSPLAGILAGLDWAAAQNATQVVTVAVDTPFFPCDLVPHLLMAGEAHPQGLAIAATSDGQHDTFGLWPVELRDALAAFLQNGGCNIRTFTDAQNAAIAKFPDTSPPSFFRIHTSDDLAHAARWNA